MFDRISTRDVKRVINFSGTSELFQKEKEIPIKQYEGVTALWNILSQNNWKYAYLADEVGMGKTYQAIGIIAMLLKTEPNAKILVIAPNASVQNNWIKEFKNFKNNNLTKDFKKLFGNNIEDSINNIEDSSTFVDSIKKKSWKTINVMRISTFSMMGYAIAGDKRLDEELKAKIDTKKLLKGLKFWHKKNIHPNNPEKLTSQNAGILCGLAFPNPCFDLVVIDEAQNLRNKNNQTTFINFWLGLKRFDVNILDDNIQKIATKIQLVKRNRSKFLLLSATPAHRSIDCVRNQMLFFEDTVKPARELRHVDLEKFMVRRLRTYSAKSKYDVRSVTAIDLYEDMSQNTAEGLEQRLFLALCQSKLAQLPDGKNNSTFKIGFLECFETYNTKKDSSKTKQWELSDSSDIQDTVNAPDKKMMLDFIESYRDKFNKDEIMPHPKLNFTKNEVECIVRNNFSNKISNTPDKALIFVRRLATVRELTEEIIHIYEEKIIEKWYKELNITSSSNISKVDAFKDAFEKKYNDRVGREDKFFEKIIESETIEMSGELTPTDEIQSEETKLIHWFAMKKKYEPRDKGRTCVSRFKKSLLLNKPNSYFFDENYIRSVYAFTNEINYADFIEKKIDNQFIMNINKYFTDEHESYFLKDGTPKTSNILALSCFLLLRDSTNKKHIALANWIKEFYEIKDINEKSKYIEYFKRKEISDILMQDSFWSYLCRRKNENFIESLPESFDSFILRENLKGITEKFLKSSEAILDIMYCYCNSQKREWVIPATERILSDGSFGERIKKLFENGTLICKQILASEYITKKREISTKLKFIDLQQWVMPATGGNKGNEGLIKRFNTPFYPDVIVCTDVLKEGVNLHLFCNKIYHYGLAWTPGDLEQRVGRIDRFFSKTHRAMGEGKDTKIEITYPYLGKSVDEHQLKRVLTFKLQVDPLMDSNGKNSRDIDINPNEGRTIKELIDDLPNEESRTISPYSGQSFL